METLPLTIENSHGKIIATFAESLLCLAIYTVDGLRNGGTIKRNGYFLYSKGV